MSGAHVPVLLNEVVEALAPKDGDVIVDGTFGGGGYARALMDAADVTLVGIDRDPTAIARAEGMRAEWPKLVPLEGRFGDVDTLLADGELGPVDGFVLDLGVSSFQLDEGERGFSFMRDGPLDMRMGNAGPSAADVVALADERALADIIFHLGEERQSRQVARAIVRARTDAPIETTLALAELVEKALGGRRGARTHPATRTFQALRMYVNDELGELARALEAAERVLSEGGRLVVVTFHSLEDRMVKQFLRERSGTSGGGSRYMPEARAEAAPSFELISRKAVEPDEAEVAANPRARSARLRAARRTEAPAWGRPVETGLDLPDLKSMERAA